MIYNEEFETMPREALESIQLRRLQATVARVYNATPFYRWRFAEAGVAPADIRSLSDLQKLPFTTKADLRDNHPFGMFAVPMDNVTRIHASSGTTGKPTVVGYIARDIQTWAEVMARSLMAAGTRCSSSASTTAPRPPRCCAAKGSGSSTDRTSTPCERGFRGRAKVA
jgi:phenylacetate-CoA ligase